LSHHITRMQQRGPVRREECADDGRGSTIVLTDSGLRTIVAAAPFSHRVVEHLAKVRDD